MISFHTHAPPFGTGAHSKVMAMYTGLPPIAPWHTAAPVLVSGSPCMLRPHTSGGWCWCTCWPRCGCQAPSAEVPAGLSSGMSMVVYYWNSAACRVMMSAKRHIALLCNMSMAMNSCAPSPRTACPESAVLVEWPAPANP